MGRNRGRHTSALCILAMTGEMETLEDGMVGRLLCCAALPKRVQNVSQV